MELITRRWILPLANYGAAIRALMPLAHAVNSRKLGRSRRGTLMAIGYAGTVLANGTVAIEVQLMRGRPRRAAYYYHEGNGPKYLKFARVSFYRFVDFRKCFRTLTQLAKPADNSN